MATLMDRVMDNSVVQHSVRNVGHRVVGYHEYRGYRVDIYMMALEIPSVAQVVEVTRYVAIGKACLTFMEAQARIDENIAIYEVVKFGKDFNLGGDNSEVETD